MAARSLAQVAAELEMLFAGDGLVIRVEQRHRQGCASAYPALWRRRLGYPAACDCGLPSRLVVTAGEPVSTGRSVRFIPEVQR